MGLNIGFLQIEPIALRLGNPLDPMMPTTPRFQPIKEFQGQADLHVTCYRGLACW